MTGLLTLWVLASVDVSVEPKFALGGAQSEPVAVTVHAKNAEGAQLTLTTNIGTISKVERTGPDTFRASFAPPAQRFPQVAVLHAAVEWKDRSESAFLPLPIHGRDTLKLHTKPNAKVVIEIAGKTFGPVQADGKGDAQVPIVAPPGVATGTAKSEDRLGNKKKTSVPLNPPSFALVRIADPRPSLRASWADAEPHPMEGLVVRVDGSAGDARGVSVTATSGAVVDLRAGESGRFVFAFRAPKKVGDGSVRLLGKPRGGGGTAGETAIAVFAGPPSKLELVLEPTLVSADQLEPVRATARAFDAEGNPVSEVQPSFSATMGTLSSKGPAESIVVLPERFGGATEARVVAELRGIQASARVQLAAGAPHRGTLVLERASIEAGAGVVRGQAEVFDRFDNPVPRAVVEVTTAEGLRGTSRELGAGRYELELSPDADTEPVDTKLTATFANGFALRAPLTVLPAPRGLSISAGPWVRAQTSFAMQAMGVGGELAFSPGTRRLELLVDVGGSWFGALAQDHEGAADPAIRKVADVSRFSAMAGVRYTLPLTSRWSAGASLLGGMNRTSTRTSVVGVAGAQDAQVATLEPSFRGGLGVLARLGPGRALLELRGGYAPSFGPVRGNLEATSVALAYLWEVR